MSAEPIEQDSVKEKKTSKPTVIQFSIFTLLTVTLLIAISLAMMASNFFAYMIVLNTSLFIGGAVVIAVIFGRGWLQAFALGFTPVFFHNMYNWFYYFSPSDLIIGPWLITLLFGISCGSGAAIMRSQLSRRNGLAGVPNIPFLRSWLSN